MFVLYWSLQRRVSIWTSLNGPRTAQVIDRLSPIIVHNRTMTPTLSAWSTFLQCWFTIDTFPEHCILFTMQLWEPLNLYLVRWCRLHAERKVLETCWFIYELFFFKKYFNFSVRQRISSWMRIRLWHSYCRSYSLLIFHTFIKYRIHRFQVLPF